MTHSCDKIKVIKKDGQIIEGLLVPSSEGQIVTVKLSSGYNICVDKKNIKDMQILKEFTKGEKACEVQLEPKIKQEKLSVKKNLPTIAVLHTGGTIASKVDYVTGGVIASYSAEDFVSMFPEVLSMANVQVKLVGQLMSEDMRFTHYQLMAETIHDEVKKGVQGIVIGHGTDTLGYTAAALAFMLENIQIPVILIGAQRSSDRPSTDAALNLLCAVRFITQTDFRGVAVCMHENMDDDTCVILPACKTRKMHTTRRDAFRAVNDTPIARVSLAGDITFLQENYYQPPKGETFKPLLKMEEKVGIIKTYPNFHPDIIEAFTKNNYKGLVLEATGLGQAPTNITENLPNYEALKAFIRKGGIVVLTSQCVNGRVHPFVYTNCRRLVDIGVLFGEDMITETAYVKLAWLLGNFPSKAKELITKNLRGEISKRTQIDYGKQPYP